MQPQDDRCLRLTNAEPPKKSPFRCLKRSPLNVAIADSGTDSDEDDAVPGRSLHLSSDSFLEAAAAEAEAEDGKLSPDGSSSGTAAKRAASSRRTEQGNN